MFNHSEFKIAEQFHHAAMDAALRPGPKSRSLAMTIFGLAPPARCCSISGSLWWVLVCKGPGLLAGVPPSLESLSPRVSVRNGRTLLWKSPLMPLILGCRHEIDKRRFLWDLRVESSVGQVPLGLLLRLNYPTTAMQDRLKPIPGCSTSEMETTVDLL